MEEKLEVAGFKKLFPPKETIMDYEIAKDSYSLRLSLTMSEDGEELIDLGILIDLEKLEKISNNELHLFYQELYSDLDKIKEKHINVLKLFNL